MSWQPRKDSFKGEGTSNCVELRGYRYESRELTMGLSNIEDISNLDTAVLVVGMKTW